MLVDSAIGAAVGAIVVGTAVCIDIGIFVGLSSFDWLGNLVGTCIEVVGIFVG